MVAQVKGGSDSGESDNKSPSKPGPSNPKNPSNPDDKKDNEENNSSSSNKSNKLQCPVPEMIINGKAYCILPGLMSPHYSCDDCNNNSGFENIIYNNYEEQIEDPTGYSREHCLDNSTLELIENELPVLHNYADFIGKVAGITYDKNDYLHLHTPRSITRYAPVGENVYYPVSSCTVECVVKDENCIKCDNPLSQDDCIDIGDDHPAGPFQGIPNDACKLIYGKYAKYEGNGKCSFLSYFTRYPNGKKVFACLPTDEKYGYNGKCIPCPEFKAKGCTNTSEGILNYHEACKHLYGENAIYTGQGKCSVYDKIKKIRRFYCITGEDTECKKSEDIICHYYNKGCIRTSSFEGKYNEACKFLYGDKAKYNGNGKCSFKDDNNEERFACLIGEDIECKCPTKDAYPELCIPCGSGIKALPKGKHIGKWTCYQGRSHWITDCPVGDIFTVSEYGISSRIKGQNCDRWTPCTTCDLEFK